MTTVISLLRGINVGGRNPVKMDALRILYESLRLEHPQTYVQSGNVVFRARETEMGRLGKRIENAIEKKFGFRPGVVLRTAPEWKEIVARNPFVMRRELHPGKIGVIFFSEAPGANARDDVLRTKTDEEVHISGRELYIYFPNGMGQSKLFAAICRKLDSGTARNWNTITKLLEMAQKMGLGGS
jgi:uncharacterized protein (DUF1697 family)